MTYGNFEDLTRRAASEKILRDKAFNIAKNLKHDGYQCGIASMVYKCFDNKLPLRAQINLLEMVLKMRKFQTKN